MFIIVKYGKNEELLCNPSCAVVNLLNSIKRRAGFSRTSICLDLSDETGLVKELDVHLHDYATKHLVSHKTYVLIEKQVLAIDDDPTQDGGSPPPPNITYVPLLDNYAEVFPDFRLHVKNVEKKKRRTVSKSPSPAGVRGLKGAKVKVTKFTKKTSK